MSFFEEYEEISVDDHSTDFSDQIKRVKIVKPESEEKELARRLTTVKSNPDTFDFENLLVQMKRPKKISSKSPQVVDRLLYSHQLSLNKKRFMAQQKEYEETNSCTFKPEIINNNKRRTFKDFYQQPQEFVNNKEQKITQLRSERNKSIAQNESITRAKVGISPGSRLILKRIEKKNNSASSSDRDDTSFMSKTISVSKGIFKIMGRPPLPKSAFN